MADYEARPCWIDFLAVHGIISLLVQPKLALLPGGQRGGPKFLGCRIRGRGERPRVTVARSLSRPSPSANLVGIWKGDPLGSRIVRAPTVTPSENRVVRLRGDKLSAMRSHIGDRYENVVYAGGLTHLGGAWWFVVPASHRGRVRRQWYSGAVFIRERQVGIVIKRFGSRSLPPGRLIALDGEAGYQADTLAPGTALRLLALAIPHHQSAGHRSCRRAKSRSSSPPMARPFPRNASWAKSSIATISRTRASSCSTAARKAANSASSPPAPIASTRRCSPSSLPPTRTSTAWTRNNCCCNASSRTMVGIVTTLDGRPIEAGEIAGPVIPGHDNFQNAQAFLDGGGRRGLQEQILLSGTWNLNPWFAQVEQVPMVQIPIGYVGVVISFVGKAHEDVSGARVQAWRSRQRRATKACGSPRFIPGKHPLNTRVMKVELVPTTNIVLNWANRTESHHYDAKLSSITVRSKDGFAFNLDVSQIIHVGALDAPKVISRVGSMQNLVDHVLQPIVGNYFRNSAQDYTVLDFLSARSQRQAEAAEHIRVGPRRLRRAGHRYAHRRHQSARRN